MGSQKTMRLGDYLADSGGQFAFTYLIMGCIMDNGKSPKGK